MSKRWTVKAKGTAEAASRRVKRMLDAQKIGPSQWQRHHAKAPSGDQTEVYLGKDKNAKQTRIEIALKQAQKILKPLLPNKSIFPIKEKGILSLEWKDFLLISANSEQDPISLQWKPSILREHGLDRNDLESKIIAATSSRQRNSDEAWG